MSQIKDLAYVEMDFSKGQLPHLYGDNVHIISDPVSLGQLSDLCMAKTAQPVINNLIRELYQFLIRNLVRWEFETEIVDIKTRMDEISPFGTWSGKVTKRQISTITVNIMRAGALPSQVCFDFFCRIMDPKFIRQDHVVMSRITDMNDQVLGAELYGSKIGGSVHDSMLLFPDPMGATGSSISKIIKFYKDHVPGKAKKIFAVNLIVTPEYLKKMKADHPDVSIYALRLDRGASSKKALESIPGKYIDEESGLTEKQYIVPGGGGFGEIINNSYC